jgi:hypothetical protein
VPPARPSIPAGIPVTTRSSLVPHPNVAMPMNKAVALVVLPAMPMLFEESAAGSPNVSRPDLWDRNQVLTRPSRPSEERWWWSRSLGTGADQRTRLRSDDQKGQDTRASASRAVTGSCQRLGSPHRVSWVQRRPGPRARPQPQRLVCGQLPPGGSIRHPGTRQFGDPRAKERPLSVGP